MVDYEKICFVIMPFGEKDVGKEKIDFDPIYANIFEPAINAVPLPEGGNLTSRRTDRDFFTGDIGAEMFQYLEYSRFALCDITGLNPNVLYELGVRHRARSSGTAIFRQVDAPIPFDINQIKAFPYEYTPSEKAEEARDLVTLVLKNSLVQNRADSPIHRALKEQRENKKGVETHLADAENAIRKEDPMTAVKHYRKAVNADPDNALTRMKLGLLLKDNGMDGAVDEFAEAVRISPDYAEAFREQGICENKIFKKTGKGPDGEAALRRAIELDPEDFDALASLGGVLKRSGDMPGALSMYRKSSEVSNGHPYPLLNTLKLQAVLEGKLELPTKIQRQLHRAERARAAQVDTDTPYDPPWSFFDLSELQMYRGNVEAAVDTLKKGVLASNAEWQIETHLDTLQTMDKAGVKLAGLRESIQVLTDSL